LSPFSISATLTFGPPQRVTEVKAADDGWEVAGYAATYDLDLGNDRIRPGAFAKSLGSGDKVRFLFAHDPAQVLGKPLALREDEKGLFGRFRISKTRLGQDVHQLLHDGALDSFSIGFIAKDFERDEKAGTRLLTEVALLETSLVALPMNPAAGVTGFKAADYQTLPLEQLLEVYDTHRVGALGQAKAVAERRLAEGRRLSDAALAVLERLRHDAEADAATLLRLATTPPTPRDDEPAPVRTAGLVETHLRRARLNELRRAYGLEPLESQPA
jgi:HK97 family phage prohead protease